MDNTHLHIFCEETSKASLADAAAGVGHFEDQPLITLCCWHCRICTHNQQSSLRFDNQDCIGRSCAVSVVQHDYTCRLNAISFSIGDRQLFLQEHIGRDAVKKQGD